MENRDAYQRAEKRVKKKVGFYIHLFIYIVVNTMLFVINFSVSPPYFWAKWPLMGWGIGLMFHGLGVFIFSGNSNIIRKMIEKEIKKET